MANVAERAPKVKNRAPAPVQITAEQLLREAQERSESAVSAPKQRVANYEELDEYRQRKRQEFEGAIRRTRQNIRAWTKYANWEASQGEYPRARSVFERALDVEPTDIKLWLSYTEMELKARNVQHARNLFDRAVTLLPRVNQIWYKFVYLEELLGNVPGARQVFERWMAWEPDEKAWSAYIKMESRYSEFDRAAAIWERLVACHPEPKLWTKWAKWTEERGQIDRAREVFGMALEFFGEEEEQLEKAQGIYSSFAKMETRHKEYERARVIYKYALDRLPRSKSSQLYAAYTMFEKQYGDRSGIESTVLGKRRIQYEEEIAHTPHDYDTWFDYARLEEDAYRASEGSAEAAERVREVYERAIANTPPSVEKRHWRRYVFLFLMYAVFEESDVGDFERAREVYKACIKHVPHKSFTFAKIWLQYAQFELRRLEVNSARKVMGAAIGMCPKERLFKGYIEMELQLREFDRCRELYQKYLAYDPSNAGAWIRFAELETELGDVERARAIFDLAIDQPSLDMPELVWKSFIDFEYNQAEFENARRLYEDLLRRTSHVKVWVSFAQLEASIGQATARELRGEPDEDDEEAERVEPTAEQDQMAEQAMYEALGRAREVFERGYGDLKRRSLKEERVILLEAWKALESAHGSPEHLAKVEAMMPRVVKKRRKVDEDGSMEEVRYIDKARLTLQYYDLVFQDDEQERNPASFKLLQAALAWKQAQAAAAANGSA